MTTCIGVERPPEWLRGMRACRDDCAGCEEDHRDDCAECASAGMNALAARPQGWLRRRDYVRRDGCAGCVPAGMTAGRKDDHRDDCAARASAGMYPCVRERPPV
ncbi:PREDICTED: uncharacterized protein LOC105557427 [Vollenhovia emeryi]|uniref:uncharacterized protein LOC105557427 n=1 Tax=Vollenhovia emeryi TaxID=411798 RepID=UPI0005F48587|nr:PREDICTED: uncharacterized protein LOC105557427 [Vollenhovia emeryi]